MIKFEGLIGIGGCKGWYGMAIARIIHLVGPITQQARITPWYQSVQVIQSKEFQDDYFWYRVDNNPHEGILLQIEEARWQYCLSRWDAVVGKCHAGWSLRDEHKWMLNVRQLFPRW